MGTAWRVTLFVLVASALIVGWAPDPEPLAAEARGASLGLFATDPDYDYEAMLSEMRARGASDVLVVYQLMLSDGHSDDLRLVEGHSPHLDTLRRTIDQARAMGLRVALMPIVGLLERSEGEWRGSLSPENTGAWFAAYGEGLEQAASIAEEHHVGRLIVGSELSSLEVHDARWRRLIASIRATYGGTLTYSANWDRYEDIGFWDALDEIAVSTYFRVDAGGDASDVVRGHLARLRAFAAQHGKPLLLSEVGYPAHAEAAAFPWDETRDAPLDVALQAELLAAFCRANEDHGSAFYVWNWFGPGGPRDSGYSLRGKPAAAVFEQCMGEGERDDEERG